MSSDNQTSRFNFRFSQCQTLDDNSSMTPADISAVHRKIVKKSIKTRTTCSESQKLTRPIDILENHLHDLKTYEKQLSVFCGLWADYPRDRYHMEFRIEMGQLIGYSNIHHGKALASYDGHIINMVIVYPKELDRPLKHYRGRLGWNKKYIVWEKEDSTNQRGWCSTRRWIKLE